MISHIFKHGRAHSVHIKESDFFGKERIGTILLKTAPQVMLAQLIQALYNIVDSYFVGRYSDTALTALTVIYPLQLIIIAFAVGAGVGVNTYMARKDAVNESQKANEMAGTGTILAVVSWALFAIVSYFIMRPYVKTSATDPDAIEQAVTYGTIVCVGSLASFLEGTWTKILQARGNMSRPMTAQIAGALTNVVFDPILIFGWWIFPSMGVAGAAIATVMGQIVSAIITAFGGIKKPPKPKKLLHYVKMIYRFGYSSIIMQLLFTVYIFLLNIILAKFSDSAVTVLGLYYKAQSFFFIPLFGLQTCVIPIISYNYARNNYVRCRAVMKDSIFISASFMIVGIIFFVFFPELLLKIFSKSDEVIKIGIDAFPIIGSSFIFAVFSLMMPVFFQAIGKGIPSMALSLTRQIFVLVPVFKLLSMIDLKYSWIAFPVAEFTAGALGLILYFIELKKWRNPKTVEPSDEPTETETV